MLYSLIEIQNFKRVYCLHLQQHAPMKCQHISTRIHGTTFQNTEFLTDTALRTTHSTYQVASDLNKTEESCSTYPSEHQLCYHDHMVDHMAAFCLCVEYNLMTKQINLTLCAKIPEHNKKDKMQNRRMILK